MVSLSALHPLQPTNHTPPPALLTLISQSGARLLTTGLVSLCYDAIGCCARLAVVAMGTYVFITVIWGK